MFEFKYCPGCMAALTDLGTETALRPVCSVQCGFVHYDNPTPVVAVVVEYQGKVVLAHNRLWPKRFYGVITGFVDHAEAPDQGALRELKEELNLDATDATLIGVYPSEKMNQIIIGYHVEASGEIELNEELDDFKLVPFNQCVAWPTGTGYALRDWLRTRDIEPTMMTLPTAKVERNGKE